MAVDNTHFKGSWRPEEDAALREAVLRHGEKNWSTVARTFNQLMGRPPLLGRAPKQCRSRYLQQLVPGIKTGEWSVEEEEILVEGHKQFGNQWTLIASMLPGRTETSVKNHYNCTARRKVPSDPNRMTILQRYLAVIGIIAPPGSKGGSAKYPGLGTGYLNSASGMYFQTTSPAAAAAAAAAAKAAAGQRSRRGGSAPASHSPEGSMMGYEDYEQSELAHAYSEADFNQAYAAYAAYQEQQHHMAAAAAAAAAVVPDPAELEGEDEVAAEGAADGLLQLAHAAMLHLEELAGDGDEDHEGAGSGSGEQQHCSHEQRQEDMADAAAEAYGDNEHQQHEHEDADEQHQHQHPQKLPGQLLMDLTAAVSKAGGAAVSKSSSARPLPAWMKPELALSVMSSEESDRTAEEPDEGSPLAEQLLRQHLKSGSKRGSPNTPAALRSSQQQAGAAPAKRARSIWGMSEDATGTDAAAAAAAGSAAVPRPSRLVLDVSEPQGASSCVPAPLSLPVDPSSPAVPSVASTTAPMSDLNAHLVAMLMGAFMGAADNTAASSPAAALPPDALAAIARVMATSMSSLQAIQQQQQPSTAAPTTPAQGPSSLQLAASQLAAQGDA